MMVSLGQVYYKPLLPGDVSHALDANKVLKRLKRDLLRRLKRKLTQTTFSDRAKRSLARAMTIEIYPNSIRIIGRHPAFITLLRGQRHMQMRWLTKARAPIPIITDTGELIFRSATARSMANGSWVHPGRATQPFVEQAKTEARTYLKEQLAKEFRRQIKQKLRRSHG